MSVAKLGMVGVLALLPGCDSEGPRRDPVEVRESGACDVEAGAPEVPFEVVMNARYLCSPPGVPAAQVVTTEAAWTDLVASVEPCAHIGFAVPPATVDFDTHAVLVASASSFMSAGVRFDEARVTTGPGGALHLVATFTDPYGACDAKPGTGDANVVAVSVPRAAAANATLCQRIRQTCE